MVFDCRERITTLMAHKSYAEAMWYSKFRNERYLPKQVLSPLEVVDDGDVWGATMLAPRRTQGATQETLIVALLVCSDSAAFTKRKSLTPITATVLNLPPRMHTLFGAVLLLAVFPPQIVDFHSLMSHVLKMYADCLIGSRTCGRGFEVHDASQNATVHVLLNIACDVEDSRGLTNALACKQAPALVGACPFCELRGFRCYGQSQYYPGEHYLSPIFGYLSPVYGDLSPVFGYLSPVFGYLSPVFGYLSVSNPLSLRGWAYT
jgi:hypothetical protein